MEERLRLVNVKYLFSAGFNDLTSWNNLFIFVCFSIRYKPFNWSGFYFWSEIFLKLPSKINHFTIRKRLDTSVLAPRIMKIKPGRPFSQPLPFNWKTMRKTLFFLQAGIFICLFILMAIKSKIPLTGIGTNASWVQLHDVNSNNLVKIADRTMDYTGKANLCLATRAADYSMETRKNTESNLFNPTARTLGR